MEAVLIAWVVGAALCGALGYVVGNAKAAGAVGFWLGFFLGPLGILVAFAIDQRPKCPKCLGRIEPPAQVCQHCGEELRWPAEKEAAERAQQEAAEKEAAERMRQEAAEAHEAHLAAMRKVGAVVSKAPVRALRGFDRLLATLCGEGNDLLHWFFRCLAIIVGLLILANLLVLLFYR